MDWMPATLQMSEQAMRSPIGSKRLYALIKRDDNTATKGWSLSRWWTMWEQLIIVIRSIEIQIRGLLSSS